MNKKYNNEEIKELIKTDWFNQFYEDQKKEIKLGLKSNVDVYIYAKKEITDLEMLEIRKGLENNVDVFVYAKPEFNWLQMKEIRLGLEDNLDVSIYAKPDYKWDQMIEIRLGLKDNLDVSVYAKSEFMPCGTRNVEKCKFYNSRLFFVRGHSDDFIFKQMNIIISLSYPFHH